MTTDSDPPVSSPEPNAPAAAATPAPPSAAGETAPPPRKRRRRFKMNLAAYLIASGRTIDETAAKIDYPDHKLRTQLWKNVEFRKLIEGHRRLAADETAWRLQAYRGRMLKAIVEEIEKSNWQAVKWLADRLHLEHVPPACDPQGHRFVARPGIIKFHGRYSPEQLDAKARPEPMVVISDDI